MAGVLKRSIDVKDKVKVGKLSTKGYWRTQQALQAVDKDQHWQETLVPLGILTLVPLGILQIESGQSTVVLGNSYESSDFIVDGLQKWYELHRNQLIHDHTLELYLDNGPAVAGKRTQFINRMMEFACVAGLRLHLLYYRPYHSQYNPVEGVWAALENYWNGTWLTSVEKVVNTIQNMTWKGVSPLVIFISKRYQKGIKRNGKQMQQREKYLHRNQQIPKWDVLIEPPYCMGRLFLQ